MCTLEVNWTNICSYTKSFSTRAKFLNCDQIMGLQIIFYMLEGTEQIYNLAQPLQVLAIFC